MLKAEDLDFERIAWAMQDDGPTGADFYLNLDTGEVVLPGFEEDVDLEDVSEDNYACIERIEAYASYRHMEDFAVALPEGRARSELEAALIRSKPFRHFKDVLSGHLHVQEAWYAYQDEVMREFIIDWLVGLKAMEDPGPEDPLADATQ